jgi:hypothetical protein
MGKRRWGIEESTTVGGGRYNSGSAGSEPSDHGGGRRSEREGALQVRERDEAGNSNRRKRVSVVDFF